ncbi:MAG: NAD(P)-dependent oxidoreductase [Acidimicrobiales bacterium]
MRIVNIANGARLETVWTDEFVAGLEQLGSTTLVDDGHRIDDAEAATLLREADIAIIGWDARPLPEALADDRGSLRLVCCYSGTIKALVPRRLIAAGLPVSNWGDLPAQPVAEGAMTLLLAMLHELPRALDTQHNGGYGFDGPRLGGLSNLAVGIYGYGVIGRRFVEMLAPFDARVMIYDPYVDDLPPGVDRAESLMALCQWAEALVIHAGWSDETSGSVTAEHLAQLPDGAVIVNTARGGIIDQAALFAEVSTGRLRAGLDVLEPEKLEPEHPIRGLDNLLLTYHLITNNHWPARAGLDAKQQRVIDQLQRVADGDTPIDVFDLDRYDRST